jgi:hypothetical protein
MTLRITKMPMAWSGAAILVLAMSTQIVSAGDQMRCGSRIIKLNDTKTTVLSKCGEPDYREVVSGSDSTKREVWVYQMSSTEFVRTLTFVGFRLQDISVETHR